MDLLIGTSAVQFFFKLMLSIAFFIGIMLMVSQQALVILNNDLQKEYGVKKRLIGGIENRQINTVDRLLLKYPLVAGILIASSAFSLLLMYR